jgi:hypothetical protein
VISSSNYTFVNERLARFYGIPNVYGDAYRRVTIGNERRGGLLTQGSILTVTSYADRRHPCFAANGCSENLLAAPPPEPPPNVSDLRESPPGKPVSVRQRLEEHRRNPACAGCHARMDPFGFTLENFDGIGKWRTTNEDQTPIDASGLLPDGTLLNGTTGLQKYLLERRQQFAVAVTEKLLTYALGRGLEYDRPAVRTITRHAAANDYRWSSIIDGIVKSVPFQMSVVRSDPSVSARSSEEAKVFISRMAIDRRTVLRGMGATLALPLLDAMVPALTAAPKPVLRFRAVYVPNGIVMENWTPATAGADLSSLNSGNRSSRFAIVYSC